MFTGIIEATGKVETAEKDQDNLRLTLSCPFANELRVDQSLSHNGVCLTVTNVNESLYQVIAVSETLNRSNIGLLSTGSIVNLERCMPANGRFDGHIVQGHVDCTGILTEILDQKGSWKLYFSHPEQYMTVEKGSITVNGVSLTVVDSLPDKFSVVIIPYTWEHTNLKTLKIGDKVNLEFDIVGKYVAKLLNKKP